MAWQLGAKGITIYREGSRDIVVLKRPEKKGGKEKSAKDENKVSVDKQSEKVEASVEQSDKGISLSLDIDFGDNLSAKNNRKEKTNTILQDNEKSGKPEDDLAEWFKTASMNELIANGFCPVCRDGSKIINNGGCKSCPQCGWELCPNA